MKLVLVFNILKVAFKSLTSNRLRTFLSMLGIIIGVAAVIAVIAISSGAEQQILDRLNNLGTNLVTITPGVSTGSAGKISQQKDDLFTYELADDILALCPALERIAPYIDGSGLAIYQNVNVQGRIRATTIDFFQMVDLEIDQGRLFSTIDLDENRMVVVLGSEIANDLFAGENPIGKEIKITRGKDKYSLSVIGVLKEKGQVMFSNYDNQIFLPLTTWMNRLQKSNYVNGYSAQARSNEQASAAVEQIEYLFYQKYQDLDKVNVFSQSEMLDMATDYTQTFKILLSGIASIALLVGGIGIMNIMLASVLERIKEIGTRKALGATKKNIEVQFIAESTIISITGGIIGIILGFVLSALVSRFAGILTIVSPGSIIIAFTISVGVGIIFGYMPAKKAAQQDPVISLRSE